MSIVNDEPIEPLIKHDNKPNLNASCNKPNRIFSLLTERAKKIAKDISNDMKDFDAAVNNLLFGVEFDRIFVEQPDYKKILEWKKFIEMKKDPLKPLPSSIRHSVLENDKQVNAVYGLCVPDVIDEEVFWEKWQFYCFLRDQKSMKKQISVKNGESKELLDVEWEEWD